MRVHIALLALFGLLADAQSWMRMTSPRPITKRGPGGPCEDMDPYDRSHVQEWPVNGHDVGLAFTTSNSFVTLQATLINNGSIYDFEDLQSQIHIHRADDYCFMRIRGIDEWIGEPALFQVKQYVPGHGYNFTVCLERTAPCAGESALGRDNRLTEAQQCAAIKFVEGGPHKPTCRGFHEQLEGVVANPLDGPPMQEGDGEIKYVEADE
ncbi:hypothetical protein PG994_000264 [Apiospora phragmitis]|uniref:Copper acquisition factor BIM1-like domain-containing protein n=1 Tax=Apiospora phragmitis TaxID=2905665 RepID=A0ABR1X5R7_9PEZI